MAEIKKVGIIKAGCIGTLPILEFLLDERAERADIDVRVIGSGAKLGPEQCRETASLMVQQKPDLIILIGPAQTAPGPAEARKILSSEDIPTIVISDDPAKRIKDSLEKMRLGYIIIDADSMIGARREFLDPVEMALYNSDVIRALAITGVFNLIVEEIDKVINSLKKDETPTLPHIIIDKAKAIEAAGFENSYAKAKAMAAYDIARHVAEINTEACFKVSDWKVYIPLVAAGHEMMRMAAQLADEARELEKSGDSILRKPHFNDGNFGAKRALIEKPKRAE